MLRATILATMLTTPAAAQTPADAFRPGTPGVAAIVCEVDAVHTDPRDATDGATTDTAPRTVRVADPWGEAVLSGAGAPRPVTLFDRGRTLIFDAQREFLYLDRESHRFSYTLFGEDGVTIWRGLCRAEG